MAAMAGGVCVTVTLLMCVLGGEALDLLKAAATSGNPHSGPTVRCWCASFPNQTLCSWSEPSHRPPSHYIATYRERHRQTPVEDCELISPDSSSSAQTPASSSSSSSSSHRVWRCHLSDLKLFTDYIINVTAVYPGASSSSLTSFMLEDIVKPDPPTEIRVSPHHNTNILVEWSPPSTWTHLEIFPLKYHILCQWENGGTLKSGNMTSETTRMELKELSPGCTYMFQVCACELLGLGECSSWSSSVKITLPGTKL